MQDMTQRLLTLITSGDGDKALALALIDDSEVRHFAVAGWSSTQKEELKKGASALFENCSPT